MQNDNSAELNRVNAEPTQKAVEDEIKALKAQLAAAEIEDKPKSIKQKIKALDAKLLAEGVTAIMHSTRDDVTYNRLCEVLRGQEYRYDLGDEATVDEVLRALIRERNALLAKS